MSTRRVGSAAATRPGPSARGRAKLLPVIVVQCAHESVRVAFGMKAVTEPGAVNQRELRFAQEWPTLAEEMRIAVDEHCLHRRAGFLGDQRKAAFEVADR